MLKASPTASTSDNSQGVKQCSPGGNLNLLISPSVQSQREIKNARVEDREFAYILGAWCAHTEVGTPNQNRLTFCGVESDRVALVARCLEVYREKPLDVIPVQVVQSSCAMTRVLDRGLARHIHEVTANNTRVPWEHLITKEERRMFLRGIFDQAGWVSSGESAGIGFNKVLGYELLVDVARVSACFGMYPLLSNHHMAQFRFLDRNDWEIFRTSIGLSLARDERVLEMLCAKEFKINATSLQDYLAVMRASEDSTLSYSQLAALTGVPANSVRDWLKRGQVPRSARRYYSLQEATAGWPDPDSIGRLFRKEGLSSAEARRLAGSGEHF